jgi:hypothetical protein
MNPQQVISVGATVGTVATAAFVFEIPVALPVVGLVAAGGLLWFGACKAHEAITSSKN